MHRYRPRFSSPVFRDSSKGRTHGAAEFCLRGSAEAVAAAKAAIEALVAANR